MASFYMALAAQLDAIAARFIFQSNQERLDGMNRIGKDVVLETLERRQAAGYHVDQRLLRGVNRTRSLFLLSMEDENSYLSLIWQESDPARLLTPAGHPRTLRDVATRLIESDRSFEMLSHDLGFQRNQHQPEWFERCIPIDSDFNFEYFGWLAIVLPTGNERDQSPTGSFYIFDGIHKSLVLAKKLFNQEVVFQPIEALLLLPRPQ